MINRYRILYRDYDNPWDNSCDEAIFDGTPEQFDVYLSEMYNEWGVTVEGWEVIGCWKPKGDK